MTKKDVSSDGNRPVKYDTEPAHPVDRGWAWLILLAAWVNMFFVVGLYKTSGILFIEFQKKYNSSASVTSLTISLLNVGYSLTTLLVTSVALRKITTRLCVMTGSIVVCLVYVISAFAPTIEVLVFSFGLLLGSGQAMILPPTTALLGQYFNKRRGLANSIAQIGASGGSLIYPLLLRLLLNNYSLFGTLIFVGGIYLHIAVSGSLLRQVKFYQRSRVSASSSSREKHFDASDLDEVQNWTLDEKRPKNKAVITRSKTDSAEQKPLRKINGYAPVQDHDRRREIDKFEKVREGIYHNKDKLQSNEAPNVLISTGDTTYCKAFKSKGSNKNDMHNTKDPLLYYSPQLARAVSRMRTNSELSNSTKLESVSSLSIGRYASTELSISTVALNMTNENSAEDNATGKDVVESGSVRICCMSQKIYSTLTNGFDCNILRRVPFWFFLPSACLLCSSCSMFLIFLPPHARDKGLKDSEIALVMSFIGGVDIISLLLWGLIADCGVLQRYKLVMIAAISFGVTAHFVSFFRTFSSFVVLSVICGLFGRVYFSMYPVLLVDFLGLDSLRSALGFVIMTQTVFNALVIPLMGLIRDSTESYNLGFHLMGSMMIVGGLWLLTLPAAAKLEQKR